MQLQNCVTAAAAMPSSRYQHGAVFVAGRLHISGGAVGGGRMVEDETVGVVLDTAAGCWCPLESQPAPADDWMRRCSLFFEFVRYKVLSSDKNLPSIPQCALGLFDFSVVSCIQTFSFEPVHVYQIFQFPG